MHLLQTCGKRRLGRHFLPDELDEPHPHLFVLLNYHDGLFRAGERRSEGRSLIIYDALRSFHTRSPPGAACPSTAATVSYSNHNSVRGSSCNTRFLPWQILPAGATERLLDRSYAPWWFFLSRARARSHCKLTEQAVDAEAARTLLRKSMPEKAHKRLSMSKVLLTRAFQKDEWADNETRARARANRRPGGMGSLREGQRFSPRFFVSLVHSALTV